MQHTHPDLHLLLHSAALVEDALRKRLAEIGISPRQARILDALSRMGPVSQTLLAREFNLTPASMSTMISRLLAAGYVTREVDPREARSNIVELSEQGAERLNAIRHAWSDIDRLIESKIGVQNARELARLAGQLRDALGGRVPGARECGEAGK